MRPGCAVTVPATAPGYQDGSDALNVTDDDSLTLTLEILVSEVSEADGAAATTATVSRNDEDTSGELVVSLSSDDTTEADVPLTVTIPVGQTSSYPHP